MTCIYENENQKKKKLFETEIQSTAACVRVRTTK